MRPIISVILLYTLICSCHQQDDPAPMTTTNTFTIDGVLYHASSAVRSRIDTLIVDDTIAHTGLRLTYISTQKYSPMVSGYYIKNWSAAQNDDLFVVVQAFKDGKSYTSTGHDHVAANNLYVEGKDGSKFANAWTLNDSLNTDSVQVSCDVVEH